MDEAEYKTEFEPQQYTPYLVLMGQLWDAFVKISKEVDTVIMALYCDNITSRKPSTPWASTPTGKHIAWDILWIKFIFRADSRLAPSQWETSLQSNAVSHWLGANLESSLILLCSIQTTIPLTTLGELAIGPHRSIHLISVLEITFNWIIVIQYTNGMY